ncbi:MAG: SUMF1/EgtB/PvdO family nonheme iron enzyme [Pseudomonadota bacterium]
MRQREHTRSYLQQLRGDEDWIGQVHPALNPPLWEWLHINWFAEYWCLRHQPGAATTASWLADADSRFNSAVLAHDQRWHTDYPRRSVAQEYDAYVAAAVTAAVTTGLCPAYFAELAIHHEAMHEENFLRRAQRLRQPFRTVTMAALDPSEWLPIPAGEVTLGRTGGSVFGFDNEFGEHAVALPAFAIGRSPVSEAQFAGFVADGGYQQRRWWTDVGWHWRQQKQAVHPRYWQQAGSEWRIAELDTLRAPAADRPMRYLNAYEAEAYCAYATSMPDTGARPAQARLRLPSAAEWQLAYPQMQVLPMWEWTADEFQPYPGFVPGPYTEYSTTSFGHTRELRGHSPLLHSGLCRADFRNFFSPQRRDVCAGFRLCWTAR